MNRRPQGGMTLSELIIVTAIAATLLALGLPNLQALVHAQQVRSATNDLFGAINLARAQAIARNERVKMVPRDPEGTQWARGWTVFADRDGDGEPGRSYPCRARGSTWRLRYRLLLHQSCSAVLHRLQWRRAQLQRRQQRRGALGHVVAVSWRRNPPY